VLRNPLVCLVSQAASATRRVCPNRLARAIRVTSVQEVNPSHRLLTLDAPPVTSVFKEVAINQDACQGHINLNGEKTVVLIVRKASIVYHLVRYF
jgi:hypothetical protein